MNLLMISGKSAVETAQGKRNAFYNTLEELRTHFNRIDILCEQKAQLWDNVFFHHDIDYRRMDVMTVHVYAPFFNVAIARKLWKQYQIPMIFEIMHIPGYPRAGSIKEWLAKHYTRLSVPRVTQDAKAIRVINKETGVWLERRGVSKEKIHLVPAFYIDLDIFKPMNLEKKYDLIYVGRRAKNKGIHLVEGAGKIFKTLIVDGWAKDSAEIAQLMNESRILLMPSYNEGGPRVVLEALACGVPVLATPVGIVPEVLPQECIIDWSVKDIFHKAQRILGGNIPNISYDMSRFEKKASIKKYAEFIHHNAKR